MSAVIDTRELNRICGVLVEKGWRIEPGTSRGGAVRAFPPDGGRAFTIGCSPEARNTYATLRRHGVELDPDRVNGKRRGKYKKGLAAEPVEVAAPITTLVLPPPEVGLLPLSADEWRLTAHALEQAAARGFTVEEVLATVCAPEQMVTSKQGGNHYLRGDCKVVADPATMSVITVASRNNDNGRQSIEEHNKAVIAQQRKAPTTVAKSAPAFIPPAPTPSPNGLAKVVVPPNAPDGATFAWEDPPAPAGRAGTKTQQRIDWLTQHVLPQLKDNPGRYAKVFTFDSRSTASSLLKKLREAFPDLSFVPSQSGTKDGKPVTPEWSALHAAFYPEEKKASK